MAPVILLTRPNPDAARFAAALRADLPEAEILTSPMQRIEPAGALPPLEGVDGLIFTSRNAVRTYGDLGGLPLPCYCVGDATAGAAREAGLSATSAGGDAESLIARLLDDRPDGRWLHLHGAHLARDIAAPLRAEGIEVTAHAIYRQVAQPLSGAARALLEGAAPVIVPLFSRRSAKLFREGANPSAPTYIVTMSESVARALGPAGRTKCDIAEHPDMDSMVRATVTAYRRAARVEGDGTSK